MKYGARELYTSWVGNDDLDSIGNGVPVSGTKWVFSNRDAVASEQSFFISNPGYLPELGDLFVSQYHLSTVINRLFVDDFFVTVAMRNTTVFWFD